MSTKDIRLLIGLGNPGIKYAGTRHNIGFFALEKLAAKRNIKFHQAKKLHGLIAETSFESDPIKVLMPTTFMNDSGRSIRAAIDWFKLEISQILILVDDMDLPLGRIRLRTQGNSGGHNGLKSVIQHLGTNDFCRIRIGIGAPHSEQAERKEKTIPHVLGTFNKTELPIVYEVIDEVLDGLEVIKKLGLERAATRLNSYRNETLLEK